MSVNGHGSKVQLILTLNSITGELQVSGPINDKIFCFGMLELAKESIRAYAEQQKSQILVARPKIAL